MVIDVKFRQDGAMDLRIVGMVKLDESAPFLKEVIETKFADQKIIVDLEHLDYVDSTGIGELVQVLANLSKSGVHLALLRPSERIRKLIKVGRLEALLPIFHDREKAVASFRD